MKFTNKIETMKITRVNFNGITCRKKAIVFFCLMLFGETAFAQKIAFHKIDCIKNEYIDFFDPDRHSYLNEEIVRNISSTGLNIEKICSDDLQWAIQAGDIIGNETYFLDENGDLLEETVYSIVKVGKVLKKIGYTHVIFCIHRKGDSRANAVINQISGQSSLLKSNNSFELKFIIHDLSSFNYDELVFRDTKHPNSLTVPRKPLTFNVNYKELSLHILTSEKTDLSLKLCSDITQFTSEIRTFIFGNTNNISANYTYKSDTTNTNKTETLVPKPNTSSSNKLVVNIINNDAVKYKVVRVKDRNLTNGYPILMDIYDKTVGLKVGDNIIVTRTEEIKIPGERKLIKSETTIGNARIVEDFNKPLYTAKLFPNASSNMKDYRDGDQNYSAVRGEEKKTTFSAPKIMVIPKKIDPSKFVNGEYMLSKEEKMLISAFKKKFEDNNFTTYGFESSLKTVLENRQINDNVKDDLKSKILESSGMDFFVEYENLDQNNSQCSKVFDFKIRNYSTGEDVASDVKSLNSCGSPDDYKNFASSILNAGAITKINSQFSSLLNNGRKVSVIFTIANSSQASFNKDYNGTKLKDHIENCLQGLAFNGNLDIEGVVNLRMETTINIPIINENTGGSYTTNTFSEDIMDYLKKNANVNCEMSVSKQIVNIKIK